ncbi:glycoside hydrolase superfamily [Xylariaceae sp. FL1272]|nr:glycoside hydrolase superfamily [Xylariaceae sp. FL1272]
MVSFKSLAWALLTPLTLLVAAQATDKRVVVYYQSKLGSGDDHVSLLPLIQQGTIDVTHVLIAAVHIQDPIHINDLPPTDPTFDEMWTEVGQLQAAGVRVGCMVGGAAAGSWPALEQGDAFEANYKLLHDLIGNYNLQVVDLDVEQSFSLDGAVALINRLKTDFPDIEITLAPVASALSGGGNLSGFDYIQLEAQAGGSIAFYNAQFYSGFADASTTGDYESILDDGWPANKVVMGLLSNSANGNGFVDLDTTSQVIEELTTENGEFGGVANWEYFNSLPDPANPWMWPQWAAESMASAAAKARREVPATEAAWRSVKKMGRRTRAVAKTFYRNVIA